VTGLATATEAWLGRYGNALMATYGRPQLVLVRGEGCHVWDADGRRYLDLLGGLAVSDSEPSVRPWNAPRKATMCCRPVW